MPRSPRTIVCSCEDLTVEDIVQCIDKGYRDIESIKRYTGFGTGICQGKACLHLVARVLRSRGIKESDLAPFTARPPHRPVALGMYAELSVNPPPMNAEAANKADARKDEGFAGKDTGPGEEDPSVGREE